MPENAPAYEQSDAAVEMVLRKHLPVPFPGSDVVLCLCDVRRSYDGPIGHRLHIAAELRKAGCSVTEPTAPAYAQMTERDRPRLLELCAGEGGATRGYLDAGWHVTAVDLDAAALKRNPADVTWAVDALQHLERVIDAGVHFDAFHLSAPCQRWAANGANVAADKWPDLITPGRELLNATGKPWVMENVPKAPLRRDLILCGAMFGLTAIDDDGTLLHLDRHRVFESNVPLNLPFATRPVSPHRCGPRPGVQWAGVYGGARKDKVEARTIRKGGYVPPDAAVQSALLGGVPWMTGKGRRECIPPVYAHHIGAQLLAAVTARAAA